MNRSGEAGFTLVELLVGLVLLGLISGAIAGALRVGLLGADKIETRSARMNEVRAAQGVIRRAVEAARPVFRRDGRESLIAFEGEAEAVSFVSNLPAWAGIAGPHGVRLALEGDALVMTRQVVSGAEDRFDFGPAAERRVLLRGIRTLRFLYFGERDPRRDPEWGPDWLRRPALPGLLRLEIDFAGGGAWWPARAVAPMIAPRPR